MAHVINVRREGSNPSVESLDVDLNLVIGLDLRHMEGNLRFGGSRGGREAHVSRRGGLSHHVFDSSIPSLHGSYHSTDCRLSQGELVGNPLLLIVELDSVALPWEDTFLVRNACGDVHPTKGKKKLIEASDSVTGIRLSVPSSRRMSEARVAEPLSRDSEALPKILVGCGMKDSSTRIEDE